MRLRLFKPPFIKILGLAILIGVTGYGIFFLSKIFPLISAFRAKNICSCVFVGNRTPESVIHEELSAFPLNVGDDQINYADSMVSSSVFGMATRHAIYRHGVGCSLTNGTKWQTLSHAQLQIAPMPAIDQDTIAWPDGNVLSDSLPPFDKIMLEETLAEAFNEPDPDNPGRTRAVVVVYNGQIIAERYASGFSPDSRHAGWSMTKSITNALVGILVKQGKLDVKAPAAVEEWKNDDRKQITLHHLLQMTSGLAWEENYKGPSDATNTLFGCAHACDPAIHSTLIKEPGEEFIYSSGTTNIISRIIREKIDSNAYHTFPYTELFHKIGMYQTTMETDPGGTFVGSSFCFATARDWARFGLLYLHGGIWNSEQLLPEGWVNYSTTPAPAAKLRPYGAHFWLNAKDDREKKIYPSAPSDLFWADGYNNQKVFIIPSLDLVIVKLSASQNYMDDDSFLKGVILSIQ